VQVNGEQIGRQKLLQFFTTLRRVCGFGCVSCQYLEAKTMIHAGYDWFAFKAYRLQTTQVFRTESALFKGQSGTLSMPLELHGWQRKMRRVAYKLPLKAPCFSSASNAYALHVG
jgi:hypothetical protein